MAIGERPGQYISGIASSLAAASNAFQGSGATALDVIDSLRLRREERRQVREAERTRQRETATSSDLARILADQKLGPDELQNLDPNTDVSALLTSINDFRANQSDIEYRAAVSRYQNAQANIAEAKGTPEALQAARELEEAKLDVERLRIAATQAQTQLYQDRLAHDRERYEREIKTAEGKDDAVRMYANRRQNIQDNIAQGIESDIANSIEVYRQRTGQEPPPEMVAGWRETAEAQAPYWIEAETALMLPQWKNDVMRKYPGLGPSDFVDTFPGADLATAADITEQVEARFKELSDARVAMAGKAVGNKLYYLEKDNTGSYRAVDSDIDADENKISSAGAKGFLSNYKGFDSKDDSNNVSEILEAVGNNKQAFKDVMRQSSNGGRKKIDWDQARTLANEAGTALRYHANRLSQGQSPYSGAGLSRADWQQGIASDAADQDFLAGQPVPGESADELSFLPNLYERMVSSNPQEADAAQEEFRTRRTRVVDAFNALEGISRGNTGRSHRKLVDFVRALQNAGMSETELDADVRFLAVPNYGSRRSLESRVDNLDVAEQLLEEISNIDLDTRAKNARIKAAAEAVVNNR